MRSGIQNVDIWVRESATIINALINEVQSLTEANLPNVGDMKMTINDVPDGWLELNGQEISRTTYSDLFNYAQTLAVYRDGFGAGDGSTTFTIPTINAYLNDNSGIAFSLDNTEKLEYLFVIKT